MGDVLEAAQRKICRLCLNCEDTNFTKPEASAIEKLKTIIPELTVHFSDDCLVCSKCRNLIDKAFNLKSTFSKNHELIENERLKRSSGNIDLTSIVKSAALGENICRICLEHNGGNYVLLTDNVDDQFNKVLKYCIPELDKSVTAKRTVCSLCHVCLTQMYDFKKDCLSVQEQIQSCYDSVFPEDIDLNRVLNFSRAKDKSDFLLDFEEQDSEADIFDNIISDSHKRANSESVNDEIQPKKQKLVINQISGEELPPFQFTYELFHNPHKVKTELEDWLAQVEQYKTKFGWSDPTTIQKVLVNLKSLSQLYVWFSNIAAIMNWEQWKRKLIRAFPLKNDYHVHVTNMMKRKKLKDETYASYYKDKLKLLESLHLSDEQKVVCLLGGITDILVCCVARVGDYKTPELLLDYFKSCDEKESVKAAAEAKRRISENANITLSNLSQPGKATSTQKCTYCNNYGHTAIVCCYAKTGGHLDIVQQNGGNDQSGTNKNLGAEILEGGNIPTHTKTADQQQEERKKTRRGKRISGAESKRRRRARQDLERGALALSSRSPPNASATENVDSLAEKPRSGEGWYPGNNIDNPQDTKRKKDVHVSGVPPKKHSSSGTSLERRFVNNANKHQPSPTSYKESRATSSNLRVAIIDKNNRYGKITKEKEVLVKRALKQELDRIILSTCATSFAKPPMFQSWIYSGEFIRIVCEDDDTLRWLTNTVETFNLWQSAALAVVQSDQLPRLTKAILWIPMKAESNLEEIEMVVDRLAGQNPMVEIREWCLFHYEAKAEPRGHLLIFGIGDEDVATLRARLMRLHYLFQSLTLRVKSEKSAVHPLPSTSHASATELREVEDRQAGPCARIDFATPTSDAHPPTIFHLGDRNRSHFASNRGGN